MLEATNKKYASALKSLDATLKSLVVALNLPETSQYLRSGYRGLAVLTLVSVFCLGVLLLGISVGNQGANQPISWLSDCFTSRAEAAELPEPSAVSNAWPLQIHFIDVGHGDCILVKCQNHTWLIDGGKWKRCYKIQRYLEAQGIDHLEAVVCTHEHQDHVGGLAQALSNVSFDRVFALSPLGKKRKGYRQMIRLARTRGVPVETPEWEHPYILGGALLGFLGPVTIEENVTLKHQINNRSLVIRLQYGDHSFLFTGDIERPAELEYVKKYGVSLNSTVLKVAHHGSRTSTCQEFLDCVRPQLAVISTSELELKGRSPYSAVLDRLRPYNCKRTDINGNIVVNSDGQRLNVVTEKMGDVVTEKMGDVVTEKMADVVATNL